MSATFAPGDVVLLKSGGPRMTIASVSNNQAVCVWIEKNKTFREVFEFILLEPYKSGFIGLID